MLKALHIFDVRDIAEAYDYGGKGRGDQALQEWCSQWFGGINASLSAADERSRQVHGNLARNAAPLLSPPEPSGIWNGRGLQPVLCSPALEHMTSHQSLQVNCPQHEEMIGNVDDISYQQDVRYNANMDRDSAMAVAKWISGTKNTTCYQTVASGMPRHAPSA